MERYRLNIIYRPNRTLITGGVAVEVSIGLDFSKLFDIEAQFCVNGRAQRSGGRVSFGKNCKRNVESKLEGKILLVNYYRSGSIGKVDRLECQLKGPLLQQGQARLQFHISNTPDYFCNPSPHANGMVQKDPIQNQGEPSGGE